MLALDSKTGALVWDVEVADHETGYSKTGAPLVVKDMVITGIGGGEYGIRGFIDAYDAQTGERRWRFHTIPASGEPGNDSWEGDSWKTGGAPTWVSGAYDPELDLVYWGTGNPGPDWNGDVRLGDNLYSDSLVVLEADTGELRWFFQFTPHDIWDWDATQHPVLVDAEFGGRQRKLLLWANRNGFFYVLDRVTGEFLMAREFAKQTWATEIDEQGRPLVKPEAVPRPEGTLVFLSAEGAANWWSPAYSPLTGLFYATAYDGAETYYIGEAEYVPGQMFVGSYPERNVPRDQYFSAIRALDPETGARVWEMPLKPKSTSGLLTTAGHLVFGGSVDGYFLALDDTSGALLWRLNLGGWVHAAPITYLSQGRQQVSIAAGTSIYTFGLAE